MPLARLRIASPLLALAALLVALVLAGCGGDDGTAAPTGASGDAGSVAVVATTTVLGDVVRTVGGDAVEVSQLLQPNSDPHDYEPRPHDVVATSKAALVLASGDGLDDWVEEVVEQSASDPTLVDVAATLPVQRDGEGDDHAEDEHADAQDADSEHAGDELADAQDADSEAGDHDHGATDPHWWHDPTNVEAAVATVRDALTRANPGGRALYASNAAAYVAQLRALDAGIRRCLDAVPQAQRKLVTDHDALGYFADRYDVEVVGAVIPSLSTQAQPSAGDVAALSKVIRAEGVRAVFPESGSNRKLPTALAQETGVSAEYQLYGDALGPEDSDGATYLGMEAHNADAMVRGFTDGASGCEIAGL